METFIKVMIWLAVLAVAAYFFSAAIEDTDRLSRYFHLVLAIVNITTLYRLEK